MTISLFTGEQHSEDLKQIIHLVEIEEYLVWVYGSEEANQIVMKNLV